MRCGVKNMQTIIPSVAVKCDVRIVTTRVRPAEMYNYTHTHDRPRLSERINPFTGAACKICGLKDARTRLETVYFPIL